MSRKLLIVGSDTIHTYNYISLVEDYFDEILLLTNRKRKNVNFDVKEINFTLGFNILGSVKKIKTIINKYNPSVIHIHQANSYAFISLLATRKLNIPKVLTAWGSDILINPKKGIFLKEILKFNLKNVDVITSDSLYVANEMKAYNQCLDIQIVTFGISIEEKKMGKKNIIYSNRLHNPLYNIPKVIYAFKNFSEINPDWKLIIGAIGSETDDLKQLVRDLNIGDKVEFIGWVDPSVNNHMYQKAKIYISIPDSDATAISLLEAISNNCICFVSNLPANSEHILDGVNGFIEPNLDMIKLEKYKLINQDTLVKVNNIRREKYSKDYNQKKFIEIYDKLIRKGNK